MHEIKGGEGVVVGALGRVREGEEGVGSKSADEMDVDVEVKRGQESDVDIDIEFEDAVEEMIV